MSLVEELTEKFSVLDVPSYGKCVIIPEKDFHSDLEKMLRERGVRTFRSHMGGPVIQVPLDDLKGIKRMKAAAPEPSEIADTSSTLSAQSTPGTPSASLGRGPNWSDSENELLIALRKSGLAEEQLAAEFMKQFPHRTPAAVHNRISRLLKAGKIEHLNVLVKPLALLGSLGPKRGRGHPPKPKTESSSRSDIRSSNEPQTKSLSTVAEKSLTATPFDIKTTLTLNITVDCSDRNAVANFLEIVKELGGVTKKETS